MTVLGNTVRGYNFLEFIDNGGFGSVYKASKGEEFFAIKIFREDYVLKEYREKGENNRIQREINIMKSLNHPYLIKYIEDFKEEVMGVTSYFLVMEFAEGRTLRNLLDTEKLSEDRAKGIFVKILSGLQALHNVRGEEDEKGIIHRDLKPQNIIIGKHDHLKILDYGLSKIIDYTSITTTGNIMGSPVYMSPEQITDSKHIDKRSDLYTVGVILYEMLTNNLPYSFHSLPELYDKIKSAHPIPPRRWNPLLNNQLENIILKLLEKEPYKRFTNVSQLLDTVLNDQVTFTKKLYDLSPKFYLRLYNEKSVLEEFIHGLSNKINVEFPANHQTQQKGLLKLVQSEQFNTLIDPATLRLAYPAQDDVKGLQALPYAPPKFQIITPDYLQSQSKQQEYVKKVIDEQVRLGGDYLISPYHYLHNTNVPATIRRNPVDEWFDLDIKLLKESIDYKRSISGYANKPLYAGICLNGESLLDAAHRTYLLNIFSAFDCDGYLIYVDCIDNDTNGTVLYNYIRTLVELQEVTEKPVIAGRVNSIGLGLLCAGVSGFSSGAARFDSFYEGLYKEESEAYNLYERYYSEDLLGTVSIDRRSPVKLDSILNTLGTCSCYYCGGKNYLQIIEPKNSKLHFLEVIHKEVEAVKEISEKERIPYFISRIEKAIANYTLLPTIFKPSDYQHLKTWKEVFTELKK
jgi:eukaryotic-like serine/threonine-protein kinase